MLPRALEVLLVALLIMATLGVAFQFQNQQLLQDILLEMRNRPSVAVTFPAETNTPVIAVNPPAHPASPAPRAVILNSTPQIETNYSIPQIPAPVIDTPAPTPQVLKTIATTPTTAPSSPTPKAPTQPAPAQPTIAEQVSTQAPAPATPPATTTPAEVAPAPTAATATATPAPQTIVATAPAEISPVIEPKANPVGEAAWEVHGQTVEKIITQLMTGDYESAMQQLDPEMRKVMTREDLARYMQGQRAKYGDLKSIIYHEYISTELASQYSAFDVGVETVSGRQLVFTITLDTEKMISGLYVK